MRCAMTGLPIEDSGDAIWEDGEWISWAYLNQFIEHEPARASPSTQPAPVAPPPVEPQGAELLTLLMDAIYHSGKTKSPFPHWGRIGELYAAERFGIALTKPYTQGHDGRLGNDVTEIKTITPGKRHPYVVVKRAGNFNVLAVVRVDENYELDARLISRAHLPPGKGGKFAVISWQTACRLGSPYAVSGSTD